MSMNKIILVVFALTAVIASTYGSVSMTSHHQVAQHRSLAIQMVERSMQ
jgi:hypothetical protein